MIATPHTVPASPLDCGAERVFSVLKPEQGANALIARDIPYRQARRVSEHYQALVYRTADLPDTSCR